MADTHFKQDTYPQSHTWEVQRLDPGSEGVLSCLSYMPPPSPKCLHGIFNLVSSQWIVIEWQLNLLYMASDIFSKEHEYFKFWIRCLSRFFFLILYKIAFLSFVKICSVKPWEFILHWRSTGQNKKYILRLSNQIL